MKEINIFEYAAKHRLRFAFRGSITVEDLYYLTPQQLDSIYKVLMGEVKQNSEDSLLADKTSADDDLAVKIEIIKHIVAEKLAAEDAAKKAAVAKVEAERIRSVLARKQDAKLEAMTAEELEEKLAELTN